jgi:hypothetical protein
MLASFEGPYGDRRQEIAIIGANMDEARLRAMLESCLLTDEEMALGREAWSAFADPIPHWQVASSSVVA